MNARTITTAAVVTVLIGILPAMAADQQLINLLPPDAKVIAGVNVTQAKGSPFGQYVLTQIQSDAHGMQELRLETGFDPTTDVSELLAAGSGEPGKHGNGIVVARGNFNVAGITAAATSHQAITEVYNGFTIIQDPQHQAGTAFLSATLVVAGDLASVKAAIDRQQSPSSLPQSLLSQISQWSGSTDAWVITTVPPATLAMPAGSPKIPGVGANANALTNVKRAAAGVQFGSQVTVKAEAVADNPQDAQQMGDGLKLLANIAQMQASKDPAFNAMLQALTIGSQGNLLNISISMPSDQLQQIVAPKKTTPARRVERK